MGEKPPKLDQIPESERTPLVEWLLEIIERQQKMIEALQEEIKRLKGLKGKPKVKPSKLDPEPSPPENPSQGKRPGSAKRSKTEELQIHVTVPVRPVNVPEGSTCKGYQSFTVQDIRLETHNTLYQLERWQTPDGTYVHGKVPEGVHGHFGPTLVSFILYQHYHALVTQPLLWEQLREIGVDISLGQLSNILIEGKDRFHAEKDEILRVGLRVSRHLHVDDTGARHRGKNCICTHIGNQMFTWFQTTPSKSRINFLELLRGGESDYLVSEDALSYMKAEKLAKGPLAIITAHQGQRFENQSQWEAALSAWGISRVHHVRIATEGVLLGSVLSHGIHPGVVIVSDDAGQFNVLRHALCWIHAERTIAKLVGLDENQAKALEEVRSEIWDFYEELKIYKRYPSDLKKARLLRRFDAIFTQKTCFSLLNHALQRLHDNKLRRRPGPDPPTAVTT